MSDVIRSRALEAHAKSRTASIVAKLRAAMTQIEMDIENNQGIYPYNSGILNRAETCRRAGIRTTVLGGPAHRETTLNTLHEWLIEVRKRLALGSKSVRKVVTARADSWKERAIGSERHSNLYHLQMVTLQNRLQVAEARVVELEAESLKLQEQVSQKRVVRLPRK